MKLNQVFPCHVEKLTRDIAKTRDIEIGVQPFFFGDYPLWRTP